MKLLLVEDDKQNREFLYKAFNEQGYTVDTAADGQQALLMATCEEHDIIILDRMLPKLDGLQVLAALRATGKNTPVLILSALDKVDERVTGLKAGGDDYLTKPFAFSELAIRVEKLIKRPSQSTQKTTTVEFENVSLDFRHYKAQVNGKPLNLQPKEFKLLHFLLEHQSKLVTRTLLFESVWEYHFDPGTNVIDVHIARLRKKLLQHNAHVNIETIRGVGYRLQKAHANE
ncbi:response regulator transcription factor [Pseudoalteromonas sp. SCSIO 43095]|uniref:response regulator transcription factor n=1 Tax=Pseudoalteromonas TaxID=53246 RepID=UPI00044A38A6|nr:MULTISPECIES: response regulator transcription factor [Pseudoalteromonas]EWS96437.1 transcriptional regulator [Pseudoalteromonas sp. SCSIO_11900]MDX1360248.1 response regulator transcription factor [Pseudoalteromonas tetraodonis]ODS14922.1 DNA-binding response regulator [Pseudoalteromonas tetraodonis]URR00642.1 response regulator transcription factor [Pseudoalteromonas sp. SCSIO 43095]